jgi:hypothetical protein
MPRSDLARVGPVGRLRNPARESDLMIREGGVGITDPRLGRHEILQQRSAQGFVLARREDSLLPRRADFSCSRKVLPRRRRA